MAVKVMVAPQKVGHDLEQSFRTIKNSGARVVGLSEMDLGKSDKVSLAQKIFGKGWKSFAKDKGEHSREIPIFVHMLVWMRAISWDTIKLSNDLPGKGAGNDRWLNILRLEIWSRTWVFLMTHTNAEVQRTARSPHTIIHGPRLVAYEQQMKRIESTIGVLLKEASVGGRVVLIGDLNMLDLDEGKTYKYSPHQMFKRLGMKYDSERVVYLAWGPGLKPRGKKQVFPPNTDINPSDHARLVRRLRRA